MAKHKPEINEYIGQFDDGTYQTGAIRPPKRSSGLVAVLLVLVIFLGGLCSGLGIVNVRLLEQLSQANRETTPLAMNSQPEDPNFGNYLEGLDAPVPQIPEKNGLELQILDSPYYSAEANGKEILSAQKILDQNQASVVDVQCLTHFGAVHSGVGLVLSADGFLLTNNHVVDAAKRIFVTLPDGSIHRAALVGSDSFSDLAVLYVDVDSLTPVVFSSNKALQVTDPTLAIEQSQAGRVLRHSTVFSVSRTFHTKSISLNLIQTCTGGDSGPVFDSYGNVIGLQVGHISPYFSETDTKGTGLVIPTATIHQIVGNLITQGSIAGRPCLGIEVETISKVYQQYWQLPTGLLLTEVSENSNADICGLEEGDILIALDGIPVKSRSDLYTMLYNHQVGDTVTAVISRDDQKFTVKLTIEENSKE